MQRRIIETNQDTYLNNAVLSDLNEKIDHNHAILTNLWYKLFLSSESRFLPIHGQQGRFNLAHLNAGEQTGSYMDIFRLHCPGNASEQE